MSRLLATESHPTSPPAGPRGDLEPGPRTTAADLLVGGPDDPTLLENTCMLDGLIDATILRLEGPESFELVNEIRAGRRGPVRETVAG